MDLEEFLGNRLTKEQIEGLNDKSKIERMEKDKEDNNHRLIITLPSEVVDMSDIECKKILKNNIVKFMRSLKKELEFKRDIISVDTIRYI